MARPQKSLEEQLKLAEEELIRLQNKEEATKQKIEEIKSQIEEKNMKESYSLLKEYEISVDDLKLILASNASNNNNNKIKKVS